MASKAILTIFDSYQKGRLCFAQHVAELASKTQNIDALDKAGAIDLLKGLLTDPCAQIQQCAAIALGRMLQNSQEVTQKFLDSGFLNILISSMNGQTKQQKKATLFVLRAICKHDENTAAYVVNNNGLTILINCLEDFENYIKENAVWALGYIARHNENLAKSVVDSGALPLLILCLQEPDLSLKQVATSALSDIAKHSCELAQNIVDMGAVTHIVRNLQNTDEKLKRQTLCALSNLAKHSTEIAEVIVESEIFPTVLIHLTHPSQMVKKNAANLVREIVKHSLELTQLVVNTGGIGALIEVIAHCNDEVKIPCITALGFMAGHSEQLAMSELNCNLLISLVDILNKSNNDNLLCVTTWTVGQIGKHSPETSHTIAATGIFEKLNDFMIDPRSSEDLKCKAKNTMKLCLQKCMDLASLEPLLFNAEPSILKYVLGQYSKVLPEDPKARRLFVTSGALKKIQEIEPKPGSQLFEYISVINSCFPDEIVRYFSPGYSDTLLEKVEQYSPQLMTVLRETNSENVDVQTDLTTMIDDLSERNPNMDMVDCK